MSIPTPCFSLAMPCVPFSSLELRMELPPESIICPRRAPCRGHQCGLDRARNSPMPDLTACLTLLQFVQPLKSSVCLTLCFGTPSNPQCSIILSWLSTAYRISCCFCFELCVSLYIYFKFLESLFLIIKNREN